jgi:site-specific DNA-cytosine methylase
MVKMFLDLFSGTGSVGEVAKKLGYTVISLDRDMEAEIQIDIMDWNCHDFPKGFFDVIWASPPCTEYSKMKYISMAPRNLELADRIVQRTIEIIDYFKPDKWFIENPQTGLLKDRPFMLGIPFTDVDYCMYSDWGYKKKTRIWTAVDYEGKLCNKQCGNIRNGIHGSPIMPFKVYNLDKSLSVYRSHNKDYLYRIPEKLIIELFDKN